jgi:hypothetical protein
LIRPWLKQALGWMVASHNDLAPDYGTMHACAVKKLRQLVLEDILGFLSHIALLYWSDEKLLHPLENSRSTLAVSALYGKKSKFRFINLSAFTYFNC